VQLGVRLLQQRHPDLVVRVAARKHDGAVGSVHGKSVVDDDVVPVVALGETHHVDAVAKPRFSTHAVVEHLEQQVCTEQQRVHTTKWLSSTPSADAMKCNAKRASDTDRRRQRCTRTVSGSDE
jgi:hypothetical protein